MFVVVFHGIGGSYIGGGFYNVVVTVLELLLFLTKN